MTLKGGIPKLLLTLRQVKRLRNTEDVQKKTVIHISPLIYWYVLLRIAFMSVTCYSSTVFIFSWFLCERTFCVCSPFEL